MNVDTHWFEKGVFFAKKYFSWMARDNKRTRQKIKKYFTPEYMDALNFTGLNMSSYSHMVLTLGRSTL